MIKILGIVAGLSLIGNWGMWHMMRSAQDAEARAVAECNSEKLTTELEVAQVQAEAAREALELEREARLALDGRIEDIRSEGLTRAQELEREVANANRKLRQARQASDDVCARTPVDDELWVQFRTTTQGGSPGGGESGGEADPSAGAP